MKIFLHIQIFFINHLIIVFNKLNTKSVIVFIDCTTVKNISNKRYEKNLFYQAVEMHDKANELLHRIVGYMDAKADLKPALRFVDDPTVLIFPTKTKTPDLGQSSEINEGFVEFTEKELNKMPKQIKNLIIVNKKRCRYRKRKSGASTTTYQIRFRSAGYDISADGVTLQKAKENMLRKLQSAQPKKNFEAEIPTAFNSFALYFFETFRRNKVSSQTYKNDFHRYTHYLQPYFMETPLKSITPSSCKRILEDVQKDGKGKTAEELYSIMSIIFKGAIAHGIIEKNPLAIVDKPTYEQVNGKALSPEEEITLFKNLSEPEFIIAIALALYCGLRPNELASAVVDGAFIKGINSKRKNGKIEYKRIPIIDKLKPYIKNGIPTLPTPQLIRRRIKDTLPSHKLYDLRTTFYSKCKELGVSDIALKHFVGHALDKLENAYTDLSDIYLLKEGKKLNKW